MVPGPVKANAGKTASGLPSAIAVGPLKAKAGSVVAGAPSTIEAGPLKAKAGRIAAGVPLMIEDGPLNAKAGVGTGGFSKAATRARSAARAICSIVASAITLSRKSENR